MRVPVEIHEEQESYGRILIKTREKMRVGTQLHESRVNDENAESQCQINIRRA